MNERPRRTNDGGVTVSASGVEVRKSLVGDENEVPTVQYDIRSDRNEAVLVRLLDGLPPGISSDAVGFHPEYHGSDWTATNGRVEFHHRLEADEDVVTVCGIQLPDDVDPETLLGEPTLQIERPGDAGGATPEEVDEDVTLDLEATDGTGTGTVESAGGEGGSGDLESSDDSETDDEFDFGKTAGMGDASQKGDDAAALDTDDRSADEGKTTAPGEDTTGEATGSSSVASTLAAELRAGHLNESDRETLRQELNLGASESTDALLEHVQSKITRKREQLQSEVEDLESSIEQLYGVKADAEDLDGLRKAVQRVDDAKADAERLEAVEAGLGELRDAAAEEQRVDRLQNGLEELQSAAATTAELQQLEAQLDRLAESAAEETDLEALDERVDTLVARADDIEADLDEAETRLDGRIDDVEADLEALRSTAATEENLSDLADRVDHLGERTVDEDRFTDAIEELRSTTATKDQADSLRRRLGDIESAKADEKHLERLESTIEEEYVAMENIDGTIERRVAMGVRTLLALGIGIGAILLSAVLAAFQGTIPAAVSFAAGVVVILGWWLFISDSSLR